MDGVATMMKLDPEVKAKWVEALRSGKYKQGRYNLHYKDTYCCLGVLCEVAVQEGVLLPPEVVNGYHLYAAAQGVPPQSLIQWAFSTDKHIVKDHYVVKTKKYGRRNLIFYNDHAELSFIEIADLIEDQL